MEKVVAVSASNLEFRPGDFVREYTAAETIPDIARRGFDAERIGRKQQSSGDIPAMLTAAHAPNRLIVRWKDEHVWKAQQTGFISRMAEFHRNAGCRVVGEHRLSETKLAQVLEFEDSTKLAEKLKKYLDSGLVTYVQPDMVYKSSAIPDDPAYNGSPGPQWSLLPPDADGTNTGRISAPQAWDITTGSRDVIVAVADTGAPVDGPPRFPSGNVHPEFAENLWDGQNLQSGDIHDWYDNDGSVTDGYGHGTHVASIIGARGNNNSMMTGVAWNVSLMILKVFGPSGNIAPAGSSKDEERDAFSSSVSSAIWYASQNHASIINLSLGGEYSTGPGAQYDPQISITLRDIRDTAIRENKPGLLAVAAAGNGSGDNDGNNYPISPASIPVDNVISVGATDKQDKIALYSNRGRYRVDLGAPGGLPAYPCQASNYSNAILGLFRSSSGSGAGTGGGGDEIEPPWEPPPETFSHSAAICHTGSYAFLDGTSMAAPHVSGVAALVKTRYRWENYLGLRDRILMGVDHLIDPLTGDFMRFRTKGRLNAEKSLHKRTLIRNISTRARVENGDRVLIGGFTISNSLPVPGHTPQPLKLAFRALGPSVGVNVARLQDPTIELVDLNGGSLGANDNWATDPQAAELPPSLIPPDPRESAMVRTLSPGSYTVVVRAKEGTAHGVGLVEIYELSGGTNEERRLINLSTRCIVGTGEEAPIAGMIVGDYTAEGVPIKNDSIPDRRVLVLGRGPSLAAHDVSDPLQDPQLELVAVDNTTTPPETLIGSNDSWQTIDDDSRGQNALEEELETAGFAPGYTAALQRESVLWPTLRPGSYTARLTGAGNTTGIGLIEFYEY